MRSLAYQQAELLYQQVYITKTIQMGLKRISYA